MQSVALCPLSSSHDNRLQQTVCRRRLCKHVKAADLGPILVWMRKETGTYDEDLQILVCKRVVKEADDALAVVHDIPETMTDSTLYASVSTGAVPSADNTDRVFTKWHQRVQLRVAAGVEMVKQRGMPLPPDSGSALLLLSSRESQPGFVHWIDATQQLE